MSQKRNNRLIPYRPASMGFWPSDFLSDFFRDGWYDGFGGASTLKVDVRETPQEYIIDAEMPGFERENVEINLDENRLTISVKKDETHEETDENGRYIRRERRSGAFQRSFVLENVDTDNIRADMKNGVLTIACPKTEPVVPASRRIEIE